MSSNSTDHERTKHIDVRDHFVSENIADGSIKLTKLPPGDMIPDLLTKPLTRSKFEELLSKLGMIDSKQFDTPTKGGVETSRVGRMPLF